jgi:hypothetical protein
MLGWHPAGWFSTVPVHSTAIQFACEIPYQHAAENWLTFDYFAHLWSVVRDLDNLLLAKR